MNSTAPSLDSKPSPMPGVCYHCGLPVPLGTDFSVDIQGERRSMCCRGCQAVARAIVDGGYADFYKYRTAASPKGEEVLPDFLREAAAYDHPEVQRRFVRHEGAVREADLILEGITCAACVWLNERRIAALPGVLSVQVNYTTRRARVRWDGDKTRLGEILQAIHRIGYRAHPYDPERSQRQLESERRYLMRRLGVAGVLGMQIMILAVALYAGDWSGLEMEFRSFFGWVSLLLCIPLLLYSAQPFFTAAWRDLRNRHASMDVPVALGIGGAFAASVGNTVSGAGAIYYDSVAMFVFFLLTARYFELMARKRAADISESRVTAAPAMAVRIGPGGEQAIVPAMELRPGDRVLVRPGEGVPADGIVAEGRSSVDESLLTGESLPLVKAPGQPLIGGSINTESPLIMEVSRTGPDTVLSGILRLADRAMGEKPALAQLADRLAARFVIGVLLLAAAVAWYWWLHDPARWLPVTIAVLVVTCPCALSLATPTALTAATGRLTRLGLLVTRGHALETLARATHFIFDKTGTLTRGQLRLLDVRRFSRLTREECLHVAGALERHSEHPIARALVDAAGSSATQARDVASTPGAGIRGTVNGKNYCLGTPAYVRAQSGLAPGHAPMTGPGTDGATVVWLAGDDGLHAAFVLGDESRPGARALVSNLKRLGKEVILLTGDNEQAARRVARDLGITETGWDLLPADKLARIEALQKQGATVAVVGDGLNDAPILARAQVSIAMGGGTTAAQANADMILLSQQLPHLIEGIRLARKALHVIRGNLAWALAYNLMAVPAAAMGYVAPWAAAIGMSASSLVVVANAARLLGPR